MELRGTIPWRISGRKRSWRSTAGGPWPKRGRLAEGDGFVGFVNFPKAKKTMTGSIGNPFLGVFMLNIVFYVFFLWLSHFEQMQGRVFESMTSRMGKARDPKDLRDPKDIRRCQGSIPVSRRRTPGKILYRSRVDVGRFC